jgi:hypothetical protein
MGIMAFDTIIFGVMILDILLSDSFLRTGRIDRVAFAAELPCCGFNQFLRFRIFDVLVAGAMASFTCQVTVVTLVLHCDDCVVATFTTFVTGKMDRKSRDFNHGIRPVMTILAKGLRG